MFASRGRVQGPSQKTTHGIEASMPLRATGCAGQWSSMQHRLLEMGEKDANTKLTQHTG